MYSWDFSPLFNYMGLWWKGIQYTLGLSALIIFFGTVLGALLVPALISRRRCLRWPARVFTDVFRALPALVLLGTVYFCMPILTGIILGPFSTAVVALSINLAPFAAEAMRAGIQSIPTVQYESARILGFHGWRMARYIIVPQAIRRILPPLAGQWVSSMKLTSLAATIGVPEIWNVTGQVVTDTSLPLEARLGGATLYIAIILPCLWLVSWLETRFSVGGLGQN